MTFVSVVIPARNDAAMLANCLAALARQTRPADEIVVVDNGSSDATAAIAAAAGARVVTEPIPRNPAGVLRRLRRRAWATSWRGSTRTASARPGWLAQAIAAFEKDPQLSVLTGTGEFYGSSALVHWIGRKVYLGGMYVFVTAYLSHPPIFGSNFMMRSEVWSELRDEVHRTERNIHDDLDLSLHLRPWMQVEYDRDLVVAISARPFESWTSLKRRLQLGDPDCAQALAGRVALEPPDRPPPVA